MFMHDAPGHVAPWFEGLPLSDPRCNNDSCTAFANAHAASQAAVPYADQFLYGHWLLWIIAVAIAVPAAGFLLQSIPQVHQGAARSSPSAWDKLMAAMRWLSYRRLRGKFAEAVSLPSLGVGIIILLGWVTSTIMMFAVHPYYRGRRGYGSPPLGVRSGLMAFALVPPTFATAGKVNVITWLTGLGHEKLNAFHRWTGYLMLYTSVVHTVPFIVAPLREGGASYLRERWYHVGSLEYNGTPALGMLVGLAVLSLAPLRRLCYELFVHVHIWLAITYLGLLFWHAGDLGDSWAYLWATLALFLFQLLARVFGKTSIVRLQDEWFRTMPISLSDLGGNMVRVEMHVHGRWKWEPGQHIFLRLPTTRPLDNHPFTISNMPEDSDDFASTTTMTLYIRPQRGMTGKIAELAKYGTTKPAIVEGPYGTIIRPRIERRYDEALLFAGGGGISAILPWVEHLSRQMADPSCVTRRIRVVWAVKRSSCLGWVTRELQTAQTRLAMDALEINIWITGEAKPQEDEQVDEKSSTSPEAAPGSLRATSHYGIRPVIDDVLRVGLSSRRTAVICCGPESLKIDVSNAVGRAQTEVLRGRAVEVRLHTETFGW